MGQSDNYVLYLGLTVTPSLLIKNGGQILINGTFMALWLAFVARPVVIGSILYLFKIPWRENLLICWAGLRGAVPIILATVPILAISAANNEQISDSNLPNIFAAIFTVVVVGAIIPGAFIRPVTKWLGMQSGHIKEAAVEIDLVNGIDLGSNYSTFYVAPELTEQNYVA